MQQVAVKTFCKNSTCSASTTIGLLSPDCKIYIYIFWLYLNPDLPHLRTQDSTLFSDQRFILNIISNIFFIVFIQIFVVEEFIFDF